MLRVSVVACLLVIAVQSAYADPPSARSGLTSYAAQGIKTNLPDLAGHVYHRTLRYEDTHFAGVGYRHGMQPPALFQRAARLVYLDGLTTGVEVISVKHRGMQDHFESSLAYAIHTPYAKVSALRARLGYSLGVSYAFGDPSYERSPDDDHRRWLTYMAYELELGLERYDRVSLVTRIHHRSGAYGLFAPRGSGSNFLAVGVRVHF